MHSDWIRRDTPYLSVFSPNAGKSEKNADQINSEYGLALRSVKSEDYYLMIKDNHAIIQGDGISEV